MVGCAVSATKAVYIVDTVELMVDYLKQLWRQIREASGGLAAQSFGFFGIRGGQGESHRVEVELWWGAGRSQSHGGQTAYPIRP